MATFRKYIVCLVLIFASASEANADPVADRQAAMRQMGTIIKDAFAFVGGRAAWDADNVADLMDGLSVTATKLHQMFPQKPAAAEKTSAVDAIWANKADFNKRLNELAALTAKAKQSAGSPADFKPIFRAIGDSCKSCHDVYRKLGP